MQITLDKSDILKEIYDNYQNDSDFLYEIVNKGTNNWDSFKAVAKSILKELKKNNELDIDELLPD